MADKYRRDAHHEELADSLRLVIAAMEEETRLRVYKAMDTLPSVVYGGPCVECREKFKPGDLVTWRLRWLPQGLIHKDCQ